MFELQNFNGNILTWNCSAICSFPLSVGIVNSVESEEMTYDLIMKKEHMFLRNIRFKKHTILKFFKNQKVSMVLKTFTILLFFVQLYILLYQFYIEDSNIEFINHNVIERFINNYLDQTEFIQNLFGQESKFR